MSPRYLLAIAGRSHPDGEVERLRAATGLGCVMEGPNLLAFASPQCAHHRLGGHGLILGTLFRRHGDARAVQKLGDAEIQQILADPEARLLSVYWGGYLCAHEAGAGLRLLRDPSASLPCYYAESAAGTLIASHLDLLLAAGCPPPAIDWLALGRYHFTAGLPTPDTALAGIKELMPGCAMQVAESGAGDQVMRWSPWDYVNPDLQGEPLEKLRRVVINSVRACTSPYPRLLGSVSGGLDSSIVMASLAGSKHDLQCITLFTDDPAGDERVYARALCDHLELPLREHRYALDHVDIDRPFSPHLPRPIGRALGQAYEHAHLAVARETGADAFVTGSGGDNVFGYSQSAAAIADRWRVEGMGAALATLRDVCRQTGCGPFAALGAAARLSRRRGYAWHAAPDFLHPDLAACFTPTDLRHPWLHPAPDRLPGKAGQVASLLRMQHLLEPGRAACAPVLYPLLSQPVVETCLAIPSWEWRTGGIDRSAARRAFAGDLPDMLVRRRVKGGPDGFAAAILRRHRAAIRERLLEGELARHGMLDWDALGLRLAGTAALQGAEQMRIFDLLDTEAWVRSWLDRLSAFSPAGAPEAPVAFSPSG